MKCYEKEVKAAKKEFYNYPIPETCIWQEFHSGKERSIQIERHGRLFAIQGDEDRIQFQRRQTDHPISVPKLFVGEIPSEFHITPDKKIPPFEGCV